MFHVARRPEKPERPVVAAEPGEQHDPCAERVVPLVPLSGFAVGACGRLTLPVNQVATDGVVTVASRWRELSVKANRSAPASFAQ
jgi:hypothetical protein